MSFDFHMVRLTGCTKKRHVRSSESPLSTGKLFSVNYVYYVTVMDPVIFANLYWKKNECDSLFYYILINIFWFPSLMRISKGLLQELQLLFMRKVIRALNSGHLLSPGSNRVSLKHTSCLLIGLSLNSFPLSHHLQILNTACSMTHSVAPEAETVLQWAQYLECRP